MGGEWGGGGGETEGRKHAHKRERARDGQTDAKKKRFM